MKCFLYMWCLCSISMLGVVYVWCICGVNGECVCVTCVGCICVCVCVVCVLCIVNCGRYLYGMYVVCVSCVVYTWVWCMCDVFVSLLCVVCVVSVVCMMSVWCMYISCVVCGGG